MKTWSFYPKVALSPKGLINMPGNWSPYKYCNGDGINCVDPSGYVGVNIETTSSADVIIGKDKTYSISFSYSKEYGFEVGTYEKSSDLKISGGAGLSQSVSVEFTNAKSVKDLDGKSFNAELEVAKKGIVGGNVSFSKSRTHDNRLIIGVGGGWSGGASLKGATSIQQTEVNRIYSSRRKK